MLGFSPIAAAPIADVSADQLVLIVGQTVTTTAGTLSASSDANYTITGQSLALTQTSVNVTAAAKYTLSGQSLALTQNNLNPTAAARYTLTGQSLALAQTSVSVESNSPNIYLQSLGVAAAISSVTARVSVHVTGETLTSSQNSVSPTAGATLTLTAQTLSVTQHGTYEALAFNAPSQTVHTTLNSMRMWNKINTAQSANWTAIDTTQNPAVKHDSLTTLSGLPFVTLSGEYIITEYYPSVSWTPINTTQSPGWTEIET